MFWISQHKVQAHFRSRAAFSWFSESFRLVMQTAGVAEALSSSPVSSLDAAAAAGTPSGHMFKDAVPVIT